MSTEWDAKPLYAKLQELAWAVDARDALPAISLEIVADRLEELSEVEFKRLKDTGVMR